MRATAKDRRVTILFLLALVSVLLASATLARAERTQRGSLISALNGQISPLVLPRDRPAPVSLSLSGGLSTDDGSLLPKVSRLEIALAGRGDLFTDGLATCTRRALLNTKPAEARASCGAALVGHGTISAAAAVPGQQPFDIDAQLLAFNARTAKGEPEILLQAYSPTPPISVVVPFHVRHSGGAFATTLVADLPRALGPLPRFAGVSMTLGRRFTYRGKRRSYLSAACPAPAGFTAGFLTVAKARYTFTDGSHIGTEIVRSCRARPSR